MDWNGERKTTKGREGTEKRSAGIQKNKFPDRLHYVELLGTPLES